MSETKWINLADAAKRWKKGKQTFLDIALREGIATKTEPSKYTRAMRFIDADAMERYLSSIAITEEDLRTRYMDVGEVATCLSISVQRVYFYVTRKILRCRKVHEPGGGKMISIFEREDVLELQRKREGGNIDPRAQRRVSKSPRGESCQERQARLSAEIDAQFEAQCGEGFALRRGLAVRLLNTPRLCDHTVNPHYNPCYGRADVDAMDERLKSGEIAITADMLPLRREYGDYEGDAQRYGYSTLRNDQTFRLVACG